MGGKDAVVMDETADLEAASAAVMKGAFGFQGQKCSAVSRLYRERRGYAPVLERLSGGHSSPSVGRGGKLPRGGGDLGRQHRKIMAGI